MWRSDAHSKKSCKANKANRARRTRLASACMLASSMHACLAHHACLLQMCALCAHAMHPHARASTRPRQRARTRKWSTWSTWRTCAYKRGLSCRSLQRSAGLKWSDSTWAVGRQRCMWTRCAASVSSVSSSPTEPPHGRPSNSRRLVLLPRPFRAKLLIQRHKVIMCPTTHSQCPRPSSGGQAR